MPYDGHSARHRAGAARRLAGVAGAPAVEDHAGATASSSRASRTARRSSCSTTTGSSLAVQPNRRDSRPKCVSTVIPGMPNALPSTTLAVLRPTPGQRDQVVEPARHLAAEPLDERRAEPDRAFRLGPEEPGRLDQLLELGPVGRGVVGRVAVAGEQRRRHLVDPHVGGLRRQHRRDQQLAAGREVELAVGVGVALGEQPVDAPGAPGERQGRLDRSLGPPPVALTGIRVRRPAVPPRRLRAVLVGRGREGASPRPRGRSSACA